MRPHFTRSHVIFALSRLLCTGLAISGTADFSSVAHAADPFAENIRSTPHLSPDEEQNSFHLPPGFTIQLVASEPEIAKPMNMAFDAKGRLWVTVTREYPFPVPPGQRGRDAIKILENFDESGRARKVTTFVDGLNIPIGLYPHKNGVVAWSIPNLWNFQDTDGDGRADKRDVLYGPLGWERDTHGMNSSFTRGYDGWLYIAHGYNNNSTVRGKDGSEIRMNSGNVYRVRLDGSRVEQFTWGQVNPFGLCFDSLGNLYSADCHSEPVFQLLRGAYYPSFGKPHDGLGFGPSMVFHSHGSTAISGIAYYSDDRWPAEFRDNIFTGNVMTSVVNRDRAEFAGATPTAAERPDFIRTDDPWFRPVNIQLGPDGALYVADFYNRIIGHYEVPLQHPGRDRESGRIWRVVYTGNPKSTDPPAGRTAKSPGNLALPDSLNGLINELGSANLTRRFLAMNRLSDDFGRAAVEPLKRAISNPSSSPFQKIHILWTLYRLGSVDQNTLLSAANDRDRAVRIHAMRVLSETPSWSTELHKATLRGLDDPDAFVKRAAADSLAQHPAFENIAPLLKLEHAIPPEDTHLSHTVRMALRNQMQPDGNLNRLSETRLAEDDSRSLASVSLGLRSPESASFLLNHVRAHREAREKLTAYLRHIARYARDSDVKALVQFSRTRIAGDADLQFALLKSIQDGTVQRGSSLPQEARDWGADLVNQFLGSIDDSAHAWMNHPVDGMRLTQNPWILQKRSSSDGTESANFLSSLPPGGEQLTGILRSRPFTIPNKLRFYIAGHDGYPDRERQQRNLVRLIAAASGRVVATTYAPRNDVAQRVEWDLPQNAGEKGILEIVDGDNGNAYAWLACGRFTPAVVPLPSIDPRAVSQRRQSAAELARSLMLKNLEPVFRSLLNNPNADLETSAAAARTVVTLNPSEASAAVAAVIADPEVPSPLRRLLTGSLGSGNPEDHFSLLTEALRIAPYRVQNRIAKSLAGGSQGADQLLDTIEAAQASPRLLLETQTRNRLLAVATPSMRERITKLTTGATPISREREQLIKARKDSFGQNDVNLEKGSGIFSQACAVCHQINSQGGWVGPQLDGIGNRGLERLLEDVLDPNRNVDPAFYTTLVTLKDGELMNGLFRRDEGASLVYANAAGVDVSIQKSNVAEQRVLQTSLMPDNFGEALSPEDFDNLMAFLLSQNSSSGASTE